MYFNGNFFKRIKFFFSSTIDDNEVYKELGMDNKTIEFINDVEYFDEKNEQLVKSSEEGTKLFLQERVETGIKKIMDAKHEVYSDVFEGVQRDIINLKRLDTVLLSEEYIFDLYNYYTSSSKAYKDTYNWERCGEILFLLGLCAHEKPLMKKILMYDAQDSLIYFAPQEIRSYRESHKRFAIYNLEQSIEKYSVLLNIDSYKTNFIEHIYQILDFNDQEINHCLQEKTLTLSDQCNISLKDGYIIGKILEPIFKNDEIKMLYGKILRVQEKRVEYMIEHKKEKNQYMYDCQEYVQQHLKEINEGKYEQIRPLTYYLKS